MKTIKKIVVTGPESTGKSTLCQKLADHYNTLWVPEYAREYLEKNGTEYTFEDLLTIAKGQIQNEEKLLTGHSDSLVGISNTPLAVNHSLLFVDTDLYVMKVWSEFVFSKCNNWILNRIAERKYDLYLLCDTDLPWVEDSLREYPDQKVREKLFHFYKDMMVNQSTPWSIISGNYDERLRKAIAVIEELFSEK